MQRAFPRRRRRATPPARVRTRAVRPGAPWRPTRRRSHPAITALACAVLLAGSSRDAAATSFVLPPVADTWVDEAAPATAGGFDGFLLTDGTPGARNLAAIAFDVSGIAPGSVVASATLFLDVVVPDAGGGAARVHPATAPWNEATATWDTLAGRWDSLVTDATFSPSNAGVVAIDVTARVQAWIDGSPSYGFVLEAPGGGAAAYASRESGASAPRLVVSTVSVLTALPLATGWYLGDGRSNRSISGLGFAPDFVLVRPEGSGLAWVKTSTMPGKKSRAPAAALGYRPLHVLSLDGDGFTVSQDPDVNATGVRYDWIAVRAAPGAFALGSYGGDGGAGSTIGGLGFRPAWVMVFGDTAVGGVQRFDTQPTGWSLPFDSAGAVTGAIDSFTVDGFTIGSSARVNAAGVAYDWVAFGPAGGVATGTYLGWGFGPRSITGAGFRPDAVLLKSETAVGDAVFRSASWSGDRTARFDAGADFVDGILALTASGFDVGAAVETNALAETYHWLALAGSIPADTADVVVSASVSPPATEPGGTVTLSIGAAGAGPRTASGVEVAVRLPAALSVISAVTTAGTFDTTSGTWSIGALGAGSAELLTIVARVSPAAAPGDSLVTVARLAAAVSFDPDPSNDVDSTVVTVVAGAYRATSGVYVGDGSALRVVTGLGFAPDVVFVTGEGATPTVTATSTMPPGWSRTLAGGPPLVDGIVSLDADGFGVGADPAVNQPGVRYHWAAFRAAPGELAVGTYTGDGIDDRGITGLGLAPRFVVVVDEDVDAAQHRFAGQAGDASFPFAPSPAVADRIQALEPDGFQVGLDPSVNAPGVVYHYVAWGQGNPRVASGVYVGDATDGRTISGAGFTPSLAWVRGTTGGPTVLRPGTIAGDTTLVPDGQAPFSGGIHPLVPDGFVVGSRAEVNLAGDVFHWVAMRNTNTANVGVTALASAPVVDVGDTLAWTTTVANAGPDSTTAVDVAVLPPAGTSLVDALASAGSWSKATGLWSVGPLAAGAQATLVLRTTIDAGSGGSTRTLSATIARNDAVDPVAADDTSSVGVYVRAADVAVAVLPDTLFAAPGDTVSWTIRATGAGPDTALAVRIRHVPPPGVSTPVVATAPGTAWDSTGAWTIGALAPGDAATLRVTARVDTTTPDARLPLVARRIDGRVEDPDAANDADSTAIAVVVPPVLDDVPGSAWPASAFAGQAALALRIGVDELAGTAVVLDTTTTLAFGPAGARAVTRLANPTLVPASASGFVLAFAPVDVPAAIPADTAWPLTLTFSGTTLPGTAWAETLSTTGSNALTIETPAVRVTALPLTVTSAMPGAPDRDLLALELVNGTTGPRSLARLVVTVATAGSGTSAQRDAETPAWRLWADVDTSAGLSAPDTLLARASPSSTLVAFDSLAAWTLAPGATARLVVTADLDSSLARDGDRVDAVVADAADVVFSPPAPLADPVSALAPLDSWGWVVVDGMPAHRLVVRAGADTLTSAQPDALLAEIVVPPDGYAPDTLTALALADASGAFDPADLDAVRLVVDDGDGAWNAARDTTIGTMAWTGDRYAVSGLALPVTAPRRLFVVGDVALAPGTGDVLRPRVPRQGVQVASGDDGPIDAPVDAARSSRFVALDHVEVAPVAVAPGAAHPGERASALLALTLRNATSGTVTVDSLRLENASTGAGTPAERDGDVETLRLVRDDGSGTIDAADVELDAGAFAAGVVVLRAGVALAPGDVATFIVAADVDSSCAIDGDTLAVRLATPTDVHVSGASLVTGPFPLASASARPVDGMMAHQIRVLTAVDSTIVSQPVDNVVMQFELPGDGAHPDTLTALVLTNLGTATRDHITRLRLWRDGGDGTFDGGSGDDVWLGDLVPTDASTWKLAPMAVSLAPACGGPGVRFHVTADLAASPPSGASVQFAVPVGGVTVASGNDGPIDRPAFDPAVAFIPRPNEITVFPYSVGDHAVAPGDVDHLGFGAGFYNGFDAPVRLAGIRLFQRGAAVASEITGVHLWSDADTSGLFDPAIDSVLAVADPMGSSYAFDSLAVDLEPRRITYVFVTYDVSLGARDSVDVDFQIDSDADVDFAAKSVALRGEFPVNSPGIDVVDGMVLAQVGVRSPASRRVAPGDPNVLLAGLRVPSNGFLSDALRGIAVRNGGSAAPGADVAAMSLWRDDGDGAFDPATDAWLGPLVWTGAQWTSPAPLDVAIPTSGLDVWIAADIAPGATDGRTLQAIVPMNGITVASGNDGPLDAPLVATGVLTISTDPLLVETTTDGDRWTVGQAITVSLRARNVGTSVLAGVHAGTLGVSGGAAVTVVSGPTPAAVDLAPGADTTFAWTLRADAPGDVTFCAAAFDADSTQFAPAACSGTGRIESAPAGIALSLVDNAPLALDRGQTGRVVARTVVTYASPDTAAASIEVTGVDLGVTDGAGLPVAPSSRLSAVTLIGSNGTNTAVATTDSTASPLHLALLAPVLLAPGDSLALDVAVDVSATAELAPMRVELAAADAVHVIDANAGTPVTPSSGATFPWRTRSIAIQDGAGAVTLAADDTSRATVNTGQAGVTLLAATVTQAGGPGAADALVTSIELAFADSSGAPVAPADAVRTLTVRSGTNVLHVSESLPATGDRFTAVLASPLVVPPGADVDLRVDVDLRDFPDVGSLRARIVDAVAVDARDANSGAPLAVSAVPAFPLPSRRLVFEAPAARLEVAARPLAPPVIQPGQAGVALVRLVLDHPDTATAAIRVDSLAFDLVDAAGAGVVPADVLAQFCVVGADTLARVTALSSVSPRVETPLAPPIVLTPGARDSVTVYVDARDPLTPGTLELRLERSGIVAVDVNDGSRILGIDGAFPLVGGMSALRLPDADVACALVSRLPANVTGRERDLAAFDLVVRHRSAAGYADVDVRRLVVGAQSDDGGLDARAVFSAARLLRGDSTLAVASPSGGVAAFTLAPGVVRLAPGDVDTLTLRVDLDDPARAFRLVLADTSALRVVAVGAGAVEPVPESGAWPLRTEPAQVLGTDPARAFTNYPNPFAAGREATRVTFFLDRDARVTLRVYTLWGERVGTLLEGAARPAGLHQDVTWDGRTGDGHVVNNGVYFLVLDVDDAAGTRRLRRKVAVVR